MKHSLAYSILSLLALILVAISCANPGTPTGGPKDRKPPVLIKSTPEPNSTGFNGNMITLTFDENIQLKDQDTKFVMSPPVAAKTKLDAHGNLLRVRFDSDTCLMPATTYTLDFADCVSDLNENNILENFTFTFSTGESQDSMMISGNLYDAATVSPISGCYVLLQSNLSDTAFTSVPPVRIAKTDNYGRFAIKNVPADRQYKIFALNDQNRNYLYDQPGNELIAWMDSTVTPSWEIRQINDSVRIDSLSLSADTSQWVFEHVVRDTLVYTPDSLILFAFTENIYNQYIASDNRGTRNNIKLTFNSPMANKPRIAFPGQDNADNKDNCHATVEYSLKNDTVSIWMTDTLIYHKDSVMISVTYPVLDSLNNMVDKVDTLTLWHFEKAATDDKKDKSRGRRKTDNKNDKPQKPKTLSIRSQGSTAPYSPVNITSETPYKVFNWENIRLKHKVDTNFVEMKYTAIDDTVNLKRKAVKAEWIPGDSYVIEVDSAAVSDIYDVFCDKQEYKFTVTSLDKYGTLYIVVDKVSDNMLLQLLDNKDEVVRQNYVPKNGKVAFRYLKPSTYMIRIVYDNNRNGMFDSGDWKNNIQPEQVSFYMERVNVRANWDIKVEIETGLFTPDKFARKFRMKGSSKRNRR
ncbi:MAG: Ig-like domain-containing protein [Bacteroidales bacterium]|nr:Ig-like domain-containing protein [Bacteroidales bacterium]